MQPSAMRNTCTTADRLCVRVFHMVLTCRTRIPCALRLPLASRGAWLKLEGVCARLHKGSSRPRARDSKGQVRAEHIKLIYANIFLCLLVTKDPQRLRT